MGQNQSNARYNRSTYDLDRGSSPALPQSNDNDDYWKVIVPVVVGASLLWAFSQQSAGVNDHTIYHRRDAFLSEGEIERQSAAFIDINVRYEKPNGESEVVLLRGINISTVKGRHMVKKEFKKINERKACGPDGVKGKVLKVCADQRLEKRFGIPENQIQVYLEHGKQTMPDEATFLQLGIRYDISVVVRDGSKRY